MPKFINAPSRVEAAGNPPKIIDEYIGRVNTRTEVVSIAHMRSPAGWSEPGQRPLFREYTVVLKGLLRVDFEGGSVDVAAGQGVVTEPNEWVRYSTPSSDGAEYIAVCMPAFSPDTVHRNKTSPPSSRTPASTRSPWGVGAPPSTRGGPPSGRGGPPSSGNR
jgi:mannose-6-phosphate isomerase-like protein (cupin superfamily)